MLRIRRAEEAIANRYHEQEMRCPVHLCIGEEAISAGVCANLTTPDVVFGNHRSHGHYMAKGGDLNAMMAEIYGKATGCCGGRGGSMHLIDNAAGFSGAVPIVGGTVPLAVGAGWSFKLKQEEHVSVVFFGDGCFEEGVLHESMNFAALKNIPTIFVCENNGMSVYTPLAERQPIRSISGVAKAHGLGVYTGDGNDVVEVAHLAGEAVAKARRGEGPQFLEFKTYRWLGHVGHEFDDDLGYRPNETPKFREDRCPLKRAAEELTQKFGWSQKDFATLEENVKAEVEASFQFSFASPDPKPQTSGDFTYAQ
ncbi:MAG: thiamine pyrophosphate-dependent dehydrogenase E1 component subunit alpha [Magnetococcales bacterium]|nr:thiamine pyrophosphate-dependent dehydrogenase E1 component subunit alpha [Magnetococcales bacterium]